MNDRMRPGLGGLVSKEDLIPWIEEVVEERGKELELAEDAPKPFKAPKPDHKLTDEEHATRFMIHQYRFRWVVGILSCLPFILASAAAFLESDAWTSLAWISSFAALASWAFYGGMRWMQSGYE